MNRRIIIICPSFPPNPGIGGRRWAKFAKILFQRGYDVWVFAFKLPNIETESHWTNDVEALQKAGRIIQVERNYPEVLDDYPTGILQKIKYRFWENYLKFRYKGNIYDRSLRWNKELIPEIQKLIIQNNTTIIATGAPFSYLTDLVELKEGNSLKLCADLRDPWSNNKIAYNKGLSTERIAQEKEKEKLVIKYYDVVFSVYKEIIEFQKQEFNEVNAIHVHLPNGFDKSESKKSLYTKENSKINFVFAGTLYEDAEYIFKEFVEYLDQLKLKDPKRYKMLQFEFYGDILPNNLRHFKNHTKVLILKKTLPLVQMLNRIALSDFSMVFLTDFMNYTLNTKFLEGVNQGNKVLVFSSPGYLTNFAEQHNIGYSMTKQEMAESFEKCFNDWETGKHKINKTPQDFLKYDVERLTDVIIGNTVS